MNRRELLKTITGAAAASVLPVPVAAASHADAAPAIGTGGDLIYGDGRGCWETPLHLRHHYGVIRLQPNPIWGASHVPSLVAIEDQCRQPQWLTELLSAARQAADADQAKVTEFLCGE